MEPKEIQTEFKKRKLRQILVVVVLVPIIGVLFYAMNNTDFELGGLTDDRIGLMAMLAMGLAAIFSLFNWRCPSCKKYLGRKMNQYYCPHCGVKLREQ